MLPQLSALSTQAQSGLFACACLFLFFVLWAKKRWGNFMIVVLACVAVMLVSTRWDLVVHIYQLASAQAQSLLAKGGH